MERSKDDLALLPKFRPPRHENADLEVCALPPGSIHQAFMEPPVLDELPPMLENRLIGPCAAKKGGARVRDCGDVVVVRERNEDKSEKKDDVVVVGGSGSCVDALKGWMLGKKIRRV
ncbi:Hypoxanthine-guanine phosphoribosyltransferase [Bienertia sinuspersici]